MKKKYILSGLIGGIFFALSYLLIDLNIFPSVMVSLVAFLAGTLIFKDDYSLDDLGLVNAQNYKNLLNTSQKDVKKLKDMQSQITDLKISENIKNIIKTTDKIMKLLNKQPEKISSASKFLNYYLPITIKILERFDEINDQNLTSNSSKEFLDRIRNLIVNIEVAFENQLNNLYSNEMIDTNAEIKVFETMLKMDGLLENSISVQKDGEINE